jgi:hypothetical protein
MKSTFWKILLIGMEIVIAALLPPAISIAAEDLLPDIFVRASDLYIHDIDSGSLPGRYLFRLANGTANRGPGMLYLRNSGLDSANKVIVNQRIFRTDSTWWERLAGSFVFHPSHEHTHFEDWCDYRIREMLPDLGVGPVVAMTEKVSFCIIDEYVFDSSLTGWSGAHFYTCDNTMQGLSVGCIDVYDKTTPGQSIDITGLENRSYWLESIADPMDRILEADENNNVSRIPVDICLSSPDISGDSIGAGVHFGSPGEVVAVEVSIRNNVPLRMIVIPFEFGGPINLIFLGVTTSGTRTEYFESVTLTGIDAANFRRTYTLLPSETPFAKPSVPAGSGVVLKLLFRLPAGQPGAQNQITIRNTSFIAPLFESACGSYTPPTILSGVAGLTCCLGQVGNVDCDPSDLVDISDLTRLIDYSLISFSPLCCAAEGNIDGLDEIDIADLSLLIDHLFINLSPLSDCR